MMLGEVAPGGTGSGLYGMLVLAVLAVFLAGLMVGRTPEYLGKKIGAREMQVRLAVPAGHPGAGAGRVRHRDGHRGGPVRDAQPGPHGLSEVLYAFTSAANNNGRRSPGSSANTDFYNIALGRRDVPRPLAADRCSSSRWPGSLGGAVQGAGRPPARCRRTGPQFVGLLVGVVVVVAGLTYVPVLALGPLAEGLS